MSWQNVAFLIVFSLIAGQLLALTIVYAIFGYRYNNFWDYLKSYQRRRRK